MSRSNRAGQTVTRVITLSLVPNAAPTGTATVNDATGQLARVAMTGSGNIVIASPVVQVPGIQDAILTANLTCVSVAVIAGGMNYSADIFIAAQGGQVGANTGQTFTPTIVGNAPDGGRDQGRPRWRWLDRKLRLRAGSPSIDPTGAGSGAVLGVPDMHTSVVTPFTLPIVAPGEYDPNAATPAVTFLPRFKYTWPDTLTAAQQGAPFVNLIRAALVAACASPIAEAIVVSEWGRPTRTRDSRLGDEGEDDFAAKIPDATPAQQTQTRRRGKASGDRSDRRKAAPPGRHDKLWQALDARSRRRAYAVPQGFSISSSPLSSRGSRRWGERLARRTCRRFAS